MKPQSGAVSKVGMAHPYDIQKDSTHKIRQTLYLIS